MEAKMTKRGRELLCKAHAGDAALSPITYIAMGSGGCTDGVPIAVTGNETELKEELIQMPVAAHQYSEELDDSTGATKVKMRYTATLGEKELPDTIMNEAGLVDGDGNLVAYLTFLPKGKDEDMEVVFCIDELF